MKVLRSSLVAGVAILAAACGDKVNVVGPSTGTTTVTPDVTAISVAPTTATMSIGQTVNFSAAVTAVGGAATTVSWSSSDAAKVSVSATGVASAIASTPGVAICATSTVNTGTKGCASVAVTAAAVSNPATVSIASITAVTTNNPVNPLNTAGQIDIRVNVNPGTQTITKVRLTIGGVAADSQTFTAAQAASLRYAADQAAAEQSTFPQILFSVNTAAYNAATGVPRYTNGNKAIAVQVFTVAGGATTAAATATGETLTFNNVDMLTLSITPVGTIGAPVNSVAGYSWTKLTDSTDIQILPISYSGRAVNSIAMQPVCGDTTWTKVLSPFKVRYGIPAAGYMTINSNQAIGGLAACSATAATDGELPIFNSATMVDGNNPPAFAFDAATVGVFRRRIDNMGPSAPTITQSVGISGTKLTRGQGWLNDAAKLTTVRSSSNEGGTANYTGALINTRGTDAGVSAGASSTTPDPQLVSYKAYIGVDLATALASTAITSTTGIAETAGQTLCLIVRATDALGNLSPAPTSCTFNSSTNTGATFFGIDRTAPSYARYQPRGADTVNLTPVGGGAYNKFAPDSLWAGSRIVVFTADTAAGPGLAGASGARGVVFSTVRTDNGVATCTNGLSSTCTSTTGNVTTINGAVTTVPVAGAATDDYALAATAVAGYYAVSATAYDNAGNALAVGARNVLLDATVPTVGAVIGLNALSAGLQNGRVTIASDDNVGLGYTNIVNTITDGTLTLTYVCGRADIATVLSATTLVITDARAITACSAPAQNILKVDTTSTAIVGALVDPTVTVPHLLAANATVNTFDYAGNTAAAAAVAFHTLGTNPTNANVLAAMGTQRSNVASICPSAWPATGFCLLTVSTAGSTPVYNGTGNNAQSQIDLRATVSVVDSLVMATTATVDSTIAVRKTAQLANLRGTLTSSPFRTMSFLVYPAIKCTAATVPVAGCTGAGTPTPTVHGSPTGSPGTVISGSLDATQAFVAPGIGATTGLVTESIDSTTNPLVYVVSRTWRYVATWTPDKFFGTYSSLLGRSVDFTATVGAARFYAVGNYAFPGSSAVQPTTQSGVWNFGQVASSGISLSTTLRSKLGVMSARSAEITVRR